MVLGVAVNLNRAIASKHLLVQNLHLNLLSA